MEKRIQVKNKGLKCDNESCDWTDETVTVDDYKDWLNKPCPKCGENVLTSEDYTNVMNVLAIIDVFNNLPEEVMKELETNSEEKSKEFREKHNLPEDTQRVTVTVNTHKEITLGEIKPEIKN